MYLPTYTQNKTKQTSSTACAQLKLKRIHMNYEMFYFYGWVKMIAKLTVCAV